MTGKKLNDLVEEICNSNVAENNQDYLFKRYLDGDDSAKEALISANLYLILEVMSKYEIVADERDDVFQVGWVGLMNALRTYQIKGKEIFVTHAIEKIRQEINGYLKETTPQEVMLGENALELYNKIEMYADDLTTELCREPNIMEISEKSGIHIKIVESMFRLCKIKRELPRKRLSNDMELSFKTYENRMMLNKILKELSSEEKLFINCYFCDLMSKEEMAIEFDCSQEEVTILEESVLSKLKKYGEHEKQVVKTK